MDNDVAGFSAASAGLTGFSSGWSDDGGLFEPKGLDINMTSETLLHSTIDRSCGKKTFVSLVICFEYRTRSFSI